jgi:hypothetical protein
VVGTVKGEEKSKKSMWKVLQKEGKSERKVTGRYCKRSGKIKEKVCTR